MTSSRKTRSAGTRSNPLHNPKVTGQILSPQPISQRLAAMRALTSLQTLFEGTFVTELTGVTPSNVAALLNGGNINASFSAEFAAGPFASRPLPEPATLVLLAVAIVGALVSRGRSPIRRL
jgi:hypothetical protein